MTALRHCVQQFRLDDEDDFELWNLRAFAKDCEHELRPVFPIFVVLVDGELIAFYYARPQVTIRPTVAPEHRFTPRQFHDAAISVICSTARVFGEPLWLISPQSKLANPAMLSKLGLSHRSLSVFEVGL